MNIFKHSVDAELNQVPTITDKQGLKNYLKNNKLLSLSIKSNACHDKDALQHVSAVIRACAAHEPSLGIALTMHHHIVLVLAKYPQIFNNSAQIIQAVTQRECLVASAFAEGKSGVNIFQPSSQLEQFDQGICLNGSKKPCTLSSIADYYILSTSLNQRLALINLPATRQGISVLPFWNLDIFRYCDNNELQFEQVQLESDELCSLDDEQLSLCLLYGLSLFNYFALSAYIGIADRLIAYIPEKISGIDHFKIALIEYQQRNDTLLSQSLEICAKAQLLETDLNHILNLRYLVEDNLKKLVDFTLKNIGGIAVMKNPAILNLVNHLEMLKYHPTGKFQFYKQFI